MILSLQYIRGIASLLVVLFHFRFLLNEHYSQKDLGDLLFGNGLSGVDIFFILSGFIIVYSTRKKEVNDTFSFSIRRIFRIYPLLITCCCMYYIINTQFLTYATVENFRTLLISIIPLNINWNEGAPFFAYNLLYPAWTITYEIGFYVFFGVSMSISHKYRTIICSVFIIMVVSFTQYYVNGNISFSGDVSAGLFTDNWLLGYTNVITSPMMYEFVIGMFLSEIFTNINESKSIKRILSKYSLQILWISCGISIILFIIQRPYGHGVNGFGTMAMILIASSLVYEYCNITPKIKIFNFLGEISYSLYLIHAVILALFFYYKADLAEIGITGGFSVFFSLVIISITASYPIYILIEKPMINIGKRLIDKRNKSINKKETEITA